MPDCPTCGGPLPARVTRPRSYCSARCKADARTFTEVEGTIARARERGDYALADNRAAWLARARADARNGWAAARARVAETNRRVRRARGR